MRKFMKRLGLLIAAPFFIKAVYLQAALIGGLIPVGYKQFDNTSLSPNHTVYLLSNALHADIAIPINAISFSQFSFLREAGFPIDNPNLQYFVVGWGSAEFYTNTKNYSDMEIGTIWRAATGDDAVMHVSPAGDIRKTEGALKIQLSEQGFASMIDFIIAQLKTNEQGKPLILPDASFGLGDLFYVAEGRFSLFNPCNVWVSKALNEAGVSSGLWTPTTYSLYIHHKLYH